MPLSALLSGHRANEVANRQDADPIHFVSSVFDFPVVRSLRTNKTKPSLGGLCRFAAARVALAVE